MFGGSKHHLGVVLACPALATSSEEEIAAEYLEEQGILEGDQNGDMNLASGLTRAQLAGSPDATKWESGTCAGGTGILHQPVQVPGCPGMGQTLCRLLLFQQPDGRLRYWGLWR